MPVFFFVDDEHWRVQESEEEQVDKVVYFGFGQRVMEHVVCHAMHDMT
jgi:hypothetical protein